MSSRHPSTDSYVLSKNLPLNITCRYLNDPELRCLPCQQFCCGRLALPFRAAEHSCRYSVTDRPDRGPCYRLQSHLQRRSHIPEARCAQCTHCSVLSTLEVDIIIRPRWFGCRTGRGPSKQPSRVSIVFQQYAIDPIDVFLMYDSSPIIVIQYIMSQSGCGRYQERHHSRLPILMGRHRGEQTLSSHNRRSLRQK